MGAAISLKPVIMWFTRDLRLHDNRALNAAIETGRPVIPLYIFDEKEAIGGAQRWWLYHSLTQLSTSLAKLGLTLVLRRGDAVSVLKSVSSEVQAQGIYFSRGYEPEMRKQELEIKQLCEDTGFECHRYAGQLLFEPERALTPGGTPYKVYTPFSKRCFGLEEPKSPTAAPDGAMPFDSEPHQPRSCSPGLHPAR